MDKAEVDRWLRADVEAWKSYDSEQIGDLFSEDVRYRYHPYDEPVLGRAELVRSWLGEASDGGAVADRDKPGTYDAAYRAVAVDGDVAVATGSSTYLSGPVGELVDLPSGALLEAVVVTTLRAAVAQARPAACLVGDIVLEVRAG